MIRFIKTVIVFLILCYITYWLINLMNPDLINIGSQDILKLTLLGSVIVGFLNIGE